MRLNGFHCVAFACKDLPAEQHIDDDGNFHPKLKEDCWTLLAFVGLKPTCQPEAQQAVLDCQNAGVTIKMITEDDIHTARASVQLKKDWRKLEKFVYLQEHQQLTSLIW